jgi:hypothetical protein
MRQSGATDYSSLVTHHSSLALRDRLWLWGHEAGAYNAEWNIPAPSRITPVEAAVYLGIPNLLMVKYNGQPEPPWEQYTVPMRALRRVGWSLTGARGESSREEREAVFALAARTSNLTTLVLDDFINWDTHAPELSLDELAEIEQRRRLPDGRVLDLMMIRYSHQLEIDVAKHLRYCTQVSFWIWHAKDIGRLEADFARFEQVTPGKQRFLGCYLWDLGPGGAPIPLERVRYLCETGLRWLRAGRIAGMIVLPSCICDLELESVEWLRGWIAGLGDA